MLIHFHINYHTFGSAQLAVLWSFDQKENMLRLRSFDRENWSGVLEVDNIKTLSYKYVLIDGNKQESEWGAFRKLSLNKATKEYYCEDFWRPRSTDENIYSTDAFTEILLKRNNCISIDQHVGEACQNHIEFSIKAANIPPHLNLCITGGHQSLGNWKTYIPLSCDEFPVWKTRIPFDELEIKLEYKYVLQDPSTKELITWEEEENRQFHFSFTQSQATTVVLTDENFKYKSPWWRAAGMAIPVFSMRSKQSFGIGEFHDFYQYIDFVKQSKMKFIQVLPVNDTIATKTWTDSYPYAAISVYALHPLYIHIPSISPFGRKADQKAYNKDLKSLNALDKIDFDQVLERKFYYFKILFEQEKETFFSDKAYLKFYEEQAFWLNDYAIFCYLRDKNGTVNFNQWSDHQVHSEDVYELLDAKNKDIDQIRFYFFLQYHAYKQLLEVKDYGRQEKVVLKGDLPIGIYRYSCDAWVQPDLYYMDQQAGAPPDDYAVLGQNWGFPTYNWEKMAEDGFMWWKNRMRQLSLFFDALRIDHILGFFRIWQIPLNQVEGTMGLFNPRLPLNLDELRRYGLQDDLRRFTVPYIREHILTQLFGDEADRVKNDYMDVVWEGAYTLKKEFATQADIRDELSDKESPEILKGLYRLVSEVLLIEDPDQKGSYNPRITLNTTQSYKDLDDQDKIVIDKIYNDYYYVRHNEYWRDQAVWKLPALLDATNMLIFGEDLGMIPQSVPKVMNDLNIIPLEIQRMPKGEGLFGIPQKYDYFSVCSPSCHDMSPIRAWWETDFSLTQQYYTTLFHRLEQAPSVCTPTMVERINQDHLNSPSMLAIFPIQDLIGMDGELRNPDPKSEQINEPSNSKHYWRYRFHINIEDLLKETKFIEKIETMVKESGRS